MFCSSSEASAGPRAEASGPDLRPSTQALSGLAQDEGHRSGTMNGLHPEPPPRLRCESKDAGCLSSSACDTTLHDLDRRIVPEPVRELRRLRDVPQHEIGALPDLERAAIGKSECAGA